MSEEAIFLDWISDLVYIPSQNLSHVFVELPRCSQHSGGNLKGQRRTAIVLKKEQR